MSTNLCADMLLLGLADESQITSVSQQAQDPRRSSFSAAALRYPANRASAEEVIMQQPDVVLASRRWQAQHQSDLFARFGIRVVNVPYPNDWPGIFSSLLQVGELIGRRDRAEEILRQTRARLQRIPSPQSALSVLYLRGNGGTAAGGTYIDALLQGLNVSNKAEDYGLTGWSHVSLESILLSPPDAFLVSQTRHDVAPGGSAVTRHPLLRQLLEDRPVLTLSSLDSGCSNWGQVDTVEQLAVRLESRSQAVPARGRP
ncbi:ABC transporter substrate-binding protein [Granulosicoccus sp. 3-233]|uniref:ABC transporter substrate-binding protein n=1 Tax=Granulosicoccus sp. 3-233 TaxID=3417969 RepID=UPI003D3333E5